MYRILGFNFRYTYLSLLWGTAVYMCEVFAIVLIPQTRNLLLEVAVLEEEIVSLEKQVIHLGREIEIEGMPALDKETICESPDQNKSRIKKAEIVVSPLVSPRDSARINSKASLSSRKSIDQKKNQSKPSFPAGKALENKSSSITVSVPAPRKSLDNAGSSIKSSEPRRNSSVVPHQKPQIQRNSSFPEATPRDLKSRRLSLTKKEPTVAMHTTPFIPSKLSPPKKDEESTPPESTAFVSPSDVGKSYSQRPKIKTENRGNPPVTGNSRFSKKDLINTKVAPKTRTVKARGTPRPAGEDKGPLDTSRIPRHPLARDTIFTRTTTSSSTATSGQRMTTNKKSSSASNTSTSLNCDSSLQKPVDAEPGNNDTNNTDIPSTVREHDGDCKPIHLFPDHAKVVLLKTSQEIGFRIVFFWAGGLGWWSDTVISLSNFGLPIDDSTIAELLQVPM